MPSCASRQNIHDDIAHGVKHGRLFGGERRAEQLGRHFRHRQAARSRSTPIASIFSMCFFEIPRPITRAQHAHALGIALARARFQVQALRERNKHGRVVWWSLLNETDRVAALVELPLEQGVLRANAPRGPSDPPSS